MKNILFLFLILLHNLLSIVKSFSNKQIYSNYFLSNYNSNSIQQYSDYFLSNYFLSNYNSNSIQQYSNYYNLLTSNYNSFNDYLSFIKSTQFYPSSPPKSSGKNNEYLSIIRSTHFYTSYVSKSLPKSSGKNNEYLSIIKTISSQYTSIIYYSTSVTTLKPTFNPTFITTLNPTTFNPTLKPTTFNPTLKPTTFITTFNPTLKPSIIETPVLVFDTSLTFNNYATIELDTTTQKAIILATSNSMNISASYVEYIGSALKTRRLTIFKMQGYNIIVTLKTTLPLLGQTNPKLLYSTITGNLVNSVNSGLFTTYLIIASNALGITSFANSSILSVYNDDYIIQEPDKPYIKGVKNVYTNYKTIYIIFGALLSVYLIFYFIWFRKRYLNKIKRLRNLVDNMINTDDISIHIVEN
jgi:hypothetical protein